MAEHRGVSFHDVVGAAALSMRSAACDAFELYRSGALEPCGVLLWYPGTQQRFFLMVHDQPPEPQLMAHAAPLPFPDRED